MSEIIERPSSDWSRKVKCDKCATKTRYDQDDLESDTFKVSGYSFAGTDKWERKWFLTCPVCGRYEVVPDKDVPEIVRIYVREQGRYHKP